MFAGRLENNEMYEAQLAVLHEGGALAVDGATIRFTGRPLLPRAANVVLGAWLLASAFVLPHGDDAAFNAVLCGLLVSATALQAVVSLRLVPRADGRGRVPAAEVLINTAAVADNIRDIEKALNIPDLIAEGTVSYGMQSFDQSLMKWYRDKVISYESALFYSSNPSEFALRASGISAASDRTFSGIADSGQPAADISQDIAP